MSLETLPTNLQVVDFVIMYEMVTWKGLKNKTETFKIGAISKAQKAQSF